VIAHVSWRGLHLLPKWRPTRAHKKSRTQFWLSDSSGIIYHLCSHPVTGHIFQNKTQLFIGYSKFRRQRRKHETEIADDETC
jgi:hypothetical protein